MVSLPLKPDLGNASVGNILCMITIAAYYPMVLSSYFYLKEVLMVSDSNVSLQILPIVPEEQVYAVVDEVIELIRSSGVKYIIGPMETTMEGELETLMNLVVKAQDICINAGSNRVISMVKIDYKPDGVSMNEKIGKYQR